MKRIKAKSIRVFPDNPFDSYPGARYEFTAADLDPDQTFLEVYKNDEVPYVTVSMIQVEPGRLRQGLATRLYEAAAADACRRWRRPLASDTSREPEAAAFWKKQVTKGRARYDEDADRYVLACPSPTSLAGRRTRRKVRR